MSPGCGSSFSSRGTKVMVLRRGVTNEALINSTWDVIGFVTGHTAQYRHVRPHTDTLDHTHRQRHIYRQIRPNTHRQRHRRSEE